MQSFCWSWMGARVEDTVDLWRSCADQRPLAGTTYNRADQRLREKAYDRALAEVERELHSQPDDAAVRSELQARIIGSLGRFSAEALALEPQATNLLTQEFLPIGISLARWARSFDPGLGNAEIVQACRNAWTACGLQPLFGEQIELTPSVLGYSLLYPYTDNYLDQPAIRADEKRQFSDRFRLRLSGEPIYACNRHESFLWELVTLIERQYPRDVYPRVYECLLAIHRAQENSLRQLYSGEGADDPISVIDVLRLSCAKGGSSVLADACLARGTLTERESRFAFRWGVLLQLGDDLQDIQEDLRCRSATLFSTAVIRRQPLDSLADQLLSFSDCIAADMETLPDGSRMLKDLLRMSWRSLIVNAIAESHRFFTRPYLARMESSSTFGFDFLRARRNRLGRRRGLYESLFDAFVGTSDDLPAALPSPTRTLAETYGD